jgi:hypothetical protein
MRARRSGSFNQRPCSTIGLSRLICSRRLGLTWSRGELASAPHASRSFDDLSPCRNISRDQAASANHRNITDRAPEDEWILLIIQDNAELSYLLSVNWAAGETCTRQEGPRL